MAPASFIGINLGQNTITPYTPSADTFLPKPDELAAAFASYNRHLTNPNYQLRAFIASLYDITPCLGSQANNEWLWLGKLCHLLVYYATDNHNLARIKDICTMARLWHKPTHAQHEFWQHSCNQLQGDTLAKTHQAMDTYLKELISNKVHKVTTNQFRTMHRIIDFAHRSRQKITRSTNQIQQAGSPLKPRTLLFNG